MIELTGFTNASGPLTKRIWLEPDGALKSDGSACVMTRGQAHRVPVADVGALAGVIEHVRSDQALALGALRHDLPDRVEIVTKKQLAANGSAIARTARNILYRKDEPALALADFDRKGMPPAIAEELHNRGELWPTLLSIVPDLRRAAHVIRFSTSAGLYRADTGEQLPGSGGLHVYIGVRDGNDVERFLKTLHMRCWLAGFGWFIIGAGGQLLERSIVDRMVGAPERLVFEGAPILDPPLRQDKESRRPIAVEGGVLDTLAACPPLSIIEESRLRELRAKWAHRLAGDSAKARRAFMAEQSKRLAVARGISDEAALRVVSRQCEGVLLPDVVLPFDDPELAGSTVADVLADPDKFEGATLADPLEGVAYGACKARVMRRADGTLWIHSFAHGRSVYELKLDAAAVRAALEQAPKEKVVALFVDLAATSDLDPVEIDALRRLVAKKAGVGLQPLKDLLKEEQAKQAAERRKAARAKRLAERKDPRPWIDVPYLDAPWLPQMDAINAVLGKSPAAVPPARDIDGISTRLRKLSVPKMHAFDQTQANAGDDDHD